MKKFALLPILIALTACSSAPPVAHAVDTFCIKVSRYHATTEQKEAMKANQGVWEPLVNWLLSVDKAWDETCYDGP